MSENPILYSNIHSAGCRAVLMTGAELGVEFDIQDIDLLSFAHKKAAYVQMNPQHTIPFLDDNGVRLADSHAICAYLSEKYGESDRLYPKDLEKRALVDSRLHFDSGHLFARLRFLYEPILFFKSSEWPEDRVQYIQTAYDILERFVENNPYVCGDEMTIADISLIATASSLVENIPLEPEKHLKIIEWMDRMSELSYYDELNGEPARNFQAAIRALRDQNAALQAE